MRFIELCAGTAAMTFHLFGCKPPVPMMGSKRTLAPQIARHLPFSPDALPTSVHLNDPSEWGLTLSTLFSPRGWVQVAEVFESPEFGGEDKGLFDRLRLSGPPADLVLRAAIHLFLQSRTFRGKEVRPHDRGWKTHGFDPEYRAAVLPGAKDRGFFNARPQIARKLRDLSRVSWPEVIVTQFEAQEVSVGFSDVVYMDPPYQNSIQYEHTFSRLDVLETARIAHRKGARVYVSESERLELGPEFIAVPLTTRTNGSQLGRKGATEWLTFSSPKEEYHGE